MATKETMKTIKSYLLGLLEAGDPTPIEELPDEVVEKRFQTLRLALTNHDETVKQNRDLQSELNNTKKELNELKNKPFFPFPMNSGDGLDFGEFILISHAWFSFLNTLQQIGIVEVEYKAQKRRVLYVGITNPIATAEGFKKSVLEIASFGQKIKDSGDGF